MTETNPDATNTQKKVSKKKTARRRPRKAATKASAKTDEKPPAGTAAAEAGAPEFGVPEIGAPEVSVANVRAPDEATPADPPKPDATDAEPNRSAPAPAEADANQEADNATATKSRPKRRRGSRGRGRGRRNAKETSADDATAEADATTARPAGRDTEAPESVDATGTGDAESSEAATTGDEPSNGEPGSEEKSGGRGRRGRRSRGRRRGRRGGARRNGDSTPDDETETGRPTDGPGSDNGHQGPATADREELPDTDNHHEADDQQEPAELGRPVPDAKPIKPNERVMLINVAEGEECRIAVVHEKRLEELFIERASAESHVGNIYKGRITNVEPSIQAAFVDFGLGKNGFLHISDLQPQYFPDGMRQVEEVGRKTPRRERPPIQKCLRRGQEIIVQIIKEGIGTKGPTLTTYISIPGRYLVMMPGMNRLGVSRRIEDDDARRKMRRTLEELKLPPDMGFILRTAGMGQTKRELQRDLMYLQRLWKAVSKRVKSDRAPCELYQESDLVIRTIRDVYSNEFNRVVVDCERTARKVQDFLSIAMPRSASPVEAFRKNEPLFHGFAIEHEIEQLHSRHVPLPSGGSLVIDSTEALVAIDVNSGKFREHNDAEETAYRINMEAAPEIARQLRLRDLGGLILCDFVDMTMEKHRRHVEKAMRDALKKHKERAKCLRMSQFGILEITRQRMRPSIKRSIYRDCPFCRGNGLVKTPESMTLDIIRLMRVAANHDQVTAVNLRVPIETASQLQNQKRATIYELEKASDTRITIHADRHFGPDQFAIQCVDHRGGIIRVVDVPEAQRPDTEFPKRRPIIHQEAPERPESFEDMID